LFSSICFLSFPADQQKSIFYTSGLNFGDQLRGSLFVALCFSGSWLSGGKLNHQVLDHPAHPPRHYGFKPRSENAIKSLQ
jgi:hypothetical protein